ncbi:hypothetical protein PFISCL1PPCAC_6626, partial [Pristionchus fissidentatus]
QVLSSGNLTFRYGMNPQKIMHTKLDISTLMEKISLTRSCDPFLAWQFNGTDDEGLIKVEVSFLGKNAETLCRKSNSERF